MTTDPSPSEIDSHLPRRHPEVGEDDRAGSKPGDYADTIAPESAKHGGEVLILLFFVRVQNR